MSFKKQIPNIITWSRIFLMIPTLYSFFSGYKVLAVCLFSIAAFSDGLDGFIARRYNLVSAFGAKLDAICDKIYIIIGSTMTITTNLIYIIPLLFELMIASHNVYEIYIKKVDIKTTLIGKIKTVFLFFTMIMGVVWSIVNIYNFIIYILIFITLVLQIATLYSYITLKKN